MPTVGFPLPSSSYKELIKIIQGYGKIGQEASLWDVAQHTAIGETTISANNKFLSEIGIIKGGKKKQITSKGAELAIALQHEMVDETAAKWRAVVDNSDFLQKVVAAVRIRKGMDESSLEAHVAYSAGQPKTPAVATGARTVVDILQAAGLLKEDGGSIVAAVPELPPIPETVQKNLTISSPTLMGTGQIESAKVPANSTSASLSGVHLTIEVKVQCTPNELEGLGRKLRSVIQDLNKAESLKKEESGESGEASSTGEDAEV